MVGADIVAKREQGIPSRDRPSKRTRRQGRGGRWEPPKPCWNFSMYTPSYKGGAFDGLDVA